MKITAKEAATQARVSLSTIYALLKKGTISAERIGSRGRGCWRIKPEDFNRWLESCRVVPAMPPLKHIK